MIHEKFVGKSAYPWMLQHFKFICKNGSDLCDLRFDRADVPSDSKS